MEYGEIEMHIQVDASPEVVFQVVSSPEHISKWWSDEADFESVVGAEGRIVFTGATAADDKVESITVVERRPPSRFAFRWVYEAGAAPRADNSLLVTFELGASGSGTLITMTETGFRERGWEAAVLEETYLDHANGWNHFIPRLGDYASRLAASRA